MSTLATLDAIDWSAHKHAYGPAADVPDLLRALRDEATCEDALHALYGNVYHQGTRYQATPHAIPFVAELARDPSAPRRGELLQLFVKLSLGDEEGFLPGGFNPSEFRAAIEHAMANLPPDAMAEFDRHGYGPAIDLLCYETGASEVNSLMPLLSDEDPQVRLAAAYVMAWFPGEGCTSCPLLEAQLEREDDPARVANLLLSLGLLGQQSHHDVAADLFRGRLGEDQSVAVRVAAALSLAESELSDEVVDALIAGVGASEDLQALGLPWNGGDLGGFAALLLAVVGREQRERVAPALCAPLAGLAPMRSLDLSQALLHLIAPEAGFPPKGSELDETARAGLAAIAEHGGWTIDGGRFLNYSELVREYGLPDTAEGLRAYLEA